MELGKRSAVFSQAMKEYREVSTFRIGETAYAIRITVFTGKKKEREEKKEEKYTANTERASMYGSHIRAEELSPV